MRKRGNAAAILMLIVLVLAVGAGYYLYNKKSGTSGENKNETSSTENKNETKSDSGFTGAEPEKVTMLPADGVEASAIANRVWTGKEFVHTISAKMKKAETGTHYEGWLAKSSSDKNFIKTGKFESDDSDYYLEYKSKENLSDYNYVIVTLEKNDDNTPEETILIGNF